MTPHNSLRSLIGSVLFAVCYGILTGFTGLLAPLVAWMLPKKWRQPVLNVHNHILLFLFRVICGVKVEIIGREHLPEGRAVVLASNHQSEWETYLLQVLKTPISTVLKKELLSIPFFGWGLRMVQPIAIDRAKKAGALKQILKQGKERLKDGRSVLIFPEGTRTPPGSERAFNKGAAMLAASAQAPILPLVHNAGHVWPGRTWRRYPGTITVVIGPLIEVDGKDTGQIHEEMETWMRAAMRQHP
ncbi:lysophospholipid acyltransferase family protein [Marinomonas ostreistagni]|uniref:lysophospholipid acyltransferase family protein n=1 Tax=Marinomonas ostreistagni TaxID=359209 RepID=UPI00195003C3|nr:lysophospholipid acyltransferase family protein [Marinomonas ostreistagni]MBM6552335.1 1-acyl-sn-glycerol-3-phosphate acyltransferase [Marinomonas ostreistagni]